MSRLAAVTQPTKLADGSETSDRSMLVAARLCFFLGVFGAHRFYAGRTRIA